MSALRYGIPRKAELDKIVEMAVGAALARGMSYVDGVEVLWAWHGARQVAWGADYYAGASCPLALAGFERSRYGAWEVDGGWYFEQAFDRMMSRFVLPGPGMIGLGA